MNISDVTSEEKARELTTRILNTTGMIVGACHTPLQVGAMIGDLSVLGFHVDAPFRIKRQITRQEYLDCIPGVDPSVGDYPEITYYELTTD